MAILIALTLPACESGPRVRMAPGYEATDTPVQSSANVLGTPAPTRIPPTPTIAPLAMDDTLYSLPSMTFSFYPPLAWTLESEDDTYAKFVSPDQTAWMEAAVESAGYEISPEAFQAYIDAMQASLYASAQDFQQLRRENSGGKTFVTSVFMKGDQKWYALDVFYQRSQALYALSFQAYETVWNTYRPSFQQIADRITTQTGYLKPEQIYVFRRRIQSPSGVYAISVPLGWNQTRDSERIPSGVIETVASPDQEAAVEMIILNDQELLAQKDIGQISIGLIKELHGQEMRSLSDSVLDDGRIRVDWVNNKTGMNGYTFFWMNKSELNILTFRYSDAHPAAYQDALIEIVNSFGLIKK